MYRPDIDSLRTFGTRVATESEARDLGLLKAINATIDALILDQKIFSAYQEFAHDTAEKIKILKPSTPLDKDGTLAALFERAQASANQLYDSLIRKRQSAINDKRLTDDDGIVTEYSNLITVIADLHNSLNDLRWAIGEHDADLEPIEKFDSFDDLMASMKE